MPNVEKLSAKIKVTVPDSDRLYETIALRPQEWSEQASDLLRNGWESRVSPSIVYLRKYVHGLQRDIDDWKISEQFL